MQNFKKLLLGSAAIACVGVAGSESALASIFFGSGGTAGQIVYRQIGDCLYQQAQGTTGSGAPPAGPLPISTACTLGTNSSGFFGELLYAGTGSGSGKATFLGNYATPQLLSGASVSGSIPSVDFTFGINTISQYDGVQIGGTDQPLTTADVNTYQTASLPANTLSGFAGGSNGQTAFGNAIQIPTMVIPMALGYNGKDGAGTSLAIVNSDSTLHLSRQAMCGIWSGHITKWNNPILTALNGLAGNSGNITFVHRVDASGSTFLISNAMGEQCNGIVGPDNEDSGAPTVSYAQPWSDRNASCPVPAAPTTPPFAGAVGGTDLLNFFDYTTNQCGTTIPSPIRSGGTAQPTFTSASGSGALQSKVATTNGAIGYASVDYWSPIKAGSQKTAELQSQWDITHNTGAYTVANAAGASAAMTITPNFGATGSSGFPANITDPLAWTLQANNPNPVGQGAYPIAGFTWMLVYECYKPHSNSNNAWLWMRTYVNYMYGASDAQGIIAANGFATIPSPWLSSVTQILGGGGGVKGPSLIGTTPDCSASGIVGAY